jgi:hypothetical protein
MKKAAYNHLGQQLTSTTPSSCLSTAASGAPIKGTVLNNSALVVKVLASFDCTAANYSLCQRRSASRVIPREHAVVQAVAIASASAPAAIGAVAFICSRSLVPVLTMST